MENVINITSENENKFSSFIFYNRFLNEIASYYRSQYFSDTKNPPNFTFFEVSLIDPVTLPLLISLGDYLNKFHESIGSTPNKINLILDNNLHQNDILRFLYYSDFFKIVGDRDKYLSRNIFSFDERMIGAFSNNRIQHPDHKVRGYSLNDDDLWVKLIGIEGLEEKRDFLILHFTYIVNEHFKELLNSIHAFIHKNEFIDILSELITNGLIHSQSDTYVMMFTNRYRTTFSISDSGIGLYKSISEKKEKYYNSNTLMNKLKGIISFKMSEEIQNNALSIIETLYYSSLKDRKGLIDLIINVVNRYKGTFRIHNVNVQMIISSRMSNEIEPIISLRNEILDLWNKKKFKLINEQIFEELISKKKEILFDLFLKLGVSIFKKHSEDIQFSAIRIYNIQFNGVHIEAEIPQNN